MTAPDDDVVLAPIRRAILDLRRLMPSVRSATVTGVSPLRVQFDGETTPVSASPTSLVPVGPGDRVRVLHYGNTDLILGRVNTKGIPYRVWSGTTTISTTGTTPTSVQVNFPAGRFTTPPVVVATAMQSHMNAYLAEVTATYARVGVRNVVTSADFTTTVHITATQMTPTSAEG